MNPAAFARYARCYDLLYRDKDYDGEARFVDGLLRRPDLSWYGLVVARKGR